VTPQNSICADEDTFRDLVENCPDVIQSVGPDGRYLYVNQSWVNLLGYSRSDVGEMNLFEVIAPDCRKECEERFRRVLQGETLRNIETTFLDAAGRRIKMTGSASCRMVDGEPVATRGVFRPADSVANSTCADDASSDPVVVCSWCWRTREPDGSWKSTGEQIDRRLVGKISHGICYQCADKALADLENPR